MILSGVFLALCAALPISSGASGAPGFDALLTRSPESILKLAATGNSAPDIPSPDGLTQRTCEGISSRWCYYDAGGRVVYWSEEHEIDIPQGTDFGGNRKKAVRKRVIFTGGYDEVIRRQEEYNGWLKLVGWSSMAYGGGDLRWMLAKLLNAADGWIAPIGSLNMRTLSIPYLKSRVVIQRLWGRFQQDCEKASTGRYNVPGCTSGGIKWFHERREEGESFDFPDEMLEIRAETIRNAWESRLAFRAELEELLPLTRWYVEQKHHGERHRSWPRNFPKDHLEPNELPRDAMSGLAEAERRLWAAIEDAGSFEDIRR